MIHCWAKKKERKRVKLQNQQINVFCEAEQHKKEELEIVAAPRRGRKEDPPQKQINVCDGEHHRILMRIGNLVGHELQSKSGTGKRTLKGVKASNAKVLSNRIKQYNVVSGIAQANDGNNIGQLVRGDLITVKVTAQELLGANI